MLKIEWRAAADKYSTAVQLGCPTIAAHDTFSVVILPHPLDQGHVVSRVENATARSLHCIWH